MQQFKKKNFKKKKNQIQKTKKTNLKENPKKQIKQQVEMKN